MIFNMVGHSDLNFSVVSYTSEDELPEIADENTIAVITDVEMTDYILSLDKPYSSAELQELPVGMIWVKINPRNISESSIYKFNALKENVLNIYPVACLQSITNSSGENYWAEKTAKIYLNGSWINLWDGYLWNYGDTCDAMTGGWGTAPISFDDSLSGVEPSITINDNGSATFSTNSDTLGGVYTLINGVDLTSFNTLKCEGSMRASDSTKNGLYIWSNDPRMFNGYGNENYVVVQYSFGSLDKSINISNLNGKHYIGIGVQGEDASVTLGSLQLSLATTSDYSFDA